MTATMIVYGSLSGLLDGQPVAAGSIDTPASFSVKGTRHEVTVSIANAANAALYANTLGQVNTIAIECNQNTRIAWKDTGGASWSQAIRGTGKKNQYGAPLILTKGNTTNSTVYINSIIAHNQSNSTGKVHAVLIK